jgi:hypothetical protein
MAEATTAESSAPQAVAYKNGYKTADGKFASPTGTMPQPGATGEQNVWNSIKQKPGWSVTGGRVHVQDALGNERVYDGVAHSPSGFNIGLEIKSGKAVKTPAQRTFDSNLNSSQANTAVGTGQNKGLVVNRSLQIRTN